MRCFRWWALVKDAEVRCERSCHGSEDGFLVNSGVKGRVMVAGFLSGDEFAKRSRENRVKPQRMRMIEEEEEAMDFSMKLAVSCVGLYSWVVYKATRVGDNGG